MKKGDAMTKTRALPYLCALLIAAVSLARAEDAKPAKPWKGSAELSFVTANGNTRSTTFSNKDRFEYNKDAWLAEIEAGGLRGTSKQQLIAEQYFASEKTGYNWSPQDYVFERFRWDKDRFAGVNNRFDASVGVGRKLIDNPSDKWLAEIGSGFVWEERLPGQPRNDYASGRAYSRYEHALSATSSFSQDALYVHSFDRPRDYRVKTETAVTAAINSTFSLKTSFVWKRVGLPPPGFIKDDTIMSAAIIVSF
jgi:putative salt-induced outer membrane protein